MTDIKMATKRFEILDYVLVGICVIKKDFTVLFWNNWLEDCTGISRSKIVGKKLGEYFPHLLESSYKTRIESVFWSAAPTIFSSQFHKHILTKETHQ